MPRKTLSESVLLKRFSEAAGQIKIEGRTWHCYNPEKGIWGQYDRNYFLKYALFVIAPRQRTIAKARAILRHFEALHS